LARRKASAPASEHTLNEGRDSSAKTDPAFKSNSHVKQASWRDAQPIHPAAELFPLMSPDELKVLGADIVKNGLTSSIVLWCGDPKAPEQLLDGRNRLDAIEMVTGCQVIVGAPSLMAGEDFLACDKVIVLDKSVDPYAYVISANIHRRHLTGEQKRDLIGKLLKATPEKSNRQIAETVKADDKTVGAVRRELEATAEIPQLTKTVGKDRKARPSKRKRPPSEEKKWLPGRLRCPFRCRPRPSCARPSPLTKNSPCCASSPASSLTAPASALIPRITSSGRCCSTASSRWVR
jgi:hypothetical protein